MATEKKKGLVLSLKKFMRSKFGLALGILLALGVLFYLKGLFVAALVNGQPITRFAVINELEKRNGSDALDSLITETLIFQEARKKSLTVTQDEIDAVISDLEKSLSDSGQDLESALLIQGMTRGDLEKQIRLQKLVEKMLADEITVSDEEVASYLETNRDYFAEDLSEDELKDQAKEQLRQEKMSEKLQTWLADLKENAKINYFTNYQ